MNKLNYNEVLGKLRDKSYSPEVTWQDIEDELTLQDNISKLKEYQPKEDLWDKIEQEIAIKKSFPTKKVLVGSAIVFLFSVIGLKLYISQYRNADEIAQTAYESTIVSRKQANVTYDVESLKVPLNALEIIDANQFVLDEKVIVHFENQLRKVTQSIDEIKCLQDKYGVDDDSNRVLSRLVRHRAKIIKSMINRV